MASMGLCCELKLMFDFLSAVRALTGTLSKKFHSGCKLGYFSRDLES